MTNDQTVTQAEENARGRGMDYAATFCIDALANMLGVEEYRTCDGTEEWEGDVRGTLWNILVAADVIDEEDGAISRHRTAHSGEGCSNDDVLRCDECGCPNPVWFAPSDVWNLVVGGPEATDDPGGVLCPICFIAKAEAAGVKPNGWRIEPEGRSNGAGEAVQAVRDDQCNIEFGTVPDCDCPHEHWHIGGVCLDVHIEEDGSGHSILGNDDWQLGVKGVESIDEMRAIAFAWASQKYGLAALSAPQGEVERESFRPMSEWDQRDETVLLLVDYSDGDHPLDDATVAITIGHNNDHNIGPDEADGWKFAGWCWSHDHYVEGKGTPIGWMPLPHHPAALAQPEAGGEHG